MLNSVSSYMQQHSFFVIAVLIFLPLTVFWNLVRRRKEIRIKTSITPELRPLDLNFASLDYLKALISWIFLFMRIFVVKSGYYYIGKREEKSPLLVTANNFLTVFLVARRIGKRSARLLIIDTGGINVWCSAGKGEFSSKEIIEKASFCGLLSGDKKEKIILPKFSMSGVNLEELRQNNIDPIIGPLYAKDLPQFLDADIFDNQPDDIVQFGLKSRTFTALPTAVQFFYYFLSLYVISLDTLTPSVIWIATGIAFLYPILFPLLPGKLFAIKGVSMAFIISAIGLLALDIKTVQQLSFILFLFATSIFVALSYTGNSAVSNYSSVRKETARFLPVVFILYIIFIPLYYLKL